MGGATGKLEDLRLPFHLEHIGSFCRSHLVCKLAKYTHLILGILNSTNIYHTVLIHVINNHVIFYYMFRDISSLRVYQGAIN